MFVWIILNESIVCLIGLIVCEIIFCVFKMNFVMIIIGLMVLWGLVLWLLWFLNVMLNLFGEVMIVFVCEWIVLVG